MSNKRVVNSFLWRFTERIAAQGSNFVVSILLARLLEPSVYGTVALVTVFTSILQVFVYSGLGTALIQKKNADDTDFSTVFYFNIFSCLTLYALLFFSAPLIAGFYELPELVPVIRVLGLTLVISGFQDIQNAYVGRNLLFKRSFFSSIGATVFSAIVGISLAYLGFGLWALVGQSLTSLLVNAIILWLTVGWRPKRLFSFERLKGLLSFGWKILVTSLIDTVYKDLQTLIIGKMYSSEDLAFRNKGQFFPNAIISNLNVSIDNVLLPVMSEKQDNLSHIRSMTRRAVKIGTYVIFPVMLGMAACADRLILIFLTEKWMAAVPFMRIFCVTYMLYPIHTAKLNSLKAIGRSDLCLKIEIIRKFIGLLLLIPAMYIGVEAMAYSLLISELFTTLVGAYPAKRLLGYRYRDQIADLLPALSLSLLMVGAVLAWNFASLGALVTLVLQIVCAVAVYVSLSAILRLENFRYLISILKSYRKKKSPEDQA